MDDEHVHDVVVIGGGPAGISAALECFDVQLDTVVLESGPGVGGQLVEIPHSVRNVAAGIFENGTALQAALARSAALLGDRVRLDHGVTAANLAEGWVEAAGRRVRARALLIATGTAPQSHPAAPDGAFGGDVTYHVESRPDRFAGQKVVVVGGGTSATLDALELAGTAASVTLVHRSPELTARWDVVRDVRADPRIEDLAGWELEALHGSGRLEAADLVERASGQRRRVPVGGVVVKISRDPRTAPFRGQIDLDRRGAIVVDGSLRASRPGVYAAGDVVSGSYWRVAAAFGQGILAARAVLEDIESAA